MYRYLVLSTSSAARGSSFLARNDEKFVRVTVDGVEHE